MAKNDVAVDEAVAFAAAEEAPVEATVEEPKPKRKKPIKRKVTEKSKKYPGLKPWAPGQSGNPYGRPKKGYTFREIFDRQTDEEVEFEGQKMTLKEFMMWQLGHAVATGELVFLNGRIEQLDKRDWDSLFNMWTQRVDGPTPQQIDITSGGLPLGTMNDDQLRQYVEDRLRATRLGDGGDGATEIVDSNFVGSDEDL